MSLRSTARLHQPRSNRLTSAPAVEPVTAAELRAHLNMTSTSELSDADAAVLIAEAREYIEQATGVALISQTWRMTLDNWPGVLEQWWDGVREGSIGSLYTPDRAASVEAPRFPLQSVTSVTTYDEASNATAVTVADVFDVDVYSIPGRLTLKRSATWPTALRVNNAIEVVYVAGYGAAATDVPAPARRAVKQMAAKLHAERGDDCNVEDAYAASGAARIMDNYRLVRI